MSKCPFKSAEELGLTQAEWEALVKTLILMEAGVLKEGTPANFAARNERRKRGEKSDEIIFHMPNWRIHNRCGSVCCIGGSAEAIALRDGIAVDLSSASNRLEYKDRPDLHNLFYGYPDRRNISPEQGARALRGYLETGKTSWSKAMRGE